MIESKNIEYKQRVPPELEKEVVEDAKGAVEGAVEGLKNSFKKED